MLTKSDDSGSDFDRMFAAASQEDASLDDGPLYRRDCLWIADQVRDIGPDAIPGVVAFTVNSIQRPFYSIRSRMDDTAASGVASRFLFGHKRTALAYAIMHKQFLWDAAQDCRDGAGRRLDDFLMRLLKVPGLGIVKASFLAQMTTGHGACMDGINLHREGLRIDAFRHRTEWTDKTRLAKIRAYNSYWSARGTSAYWWDTWCAFQGTRDAKINGVRIASPGDASDVSALHRYAIDLRIG